MGYVAKILTARIITIKAKIIQMDLIYYRYSLEETDTALFQPKSSTINFNPLKPDQYFRIAAMELPQRLKYPVIIG